MELHRRLPKSIRLPFGYLVSVCQVPPKDHALYDADTTAYLDGQWDVDRGTIWLSKELSPRRKRYIFLHEFDHALVDYRLYLDRQGFLRP